MGCIWREDVKLAGGGFALQEFPVLTRPAFENGALRADENGPHDHQGWPHDRFQHQRLAQEQDGRGGIDLAQAQLGQDGYCRGGYRGQQHKCEPIHSGLLRNHDVPAPANPAQTAHGREAPSQGGPTKSGPLGNDRGNPACLHRLYTSRVTSSATLG